MKDAVEQSITLCVPDLHDKQQSYHLVIDGSKHGMGAHLSQIINNKRRIIGYFSKAVPQHKRDWGQTKLELLSLFHAIEFWKPYLKGTHFLVKTDSNSQTRLDNLFTKGNPTLRRKIQALASYNFRIVHVSGASNSIADFLSRFPFKKKFKDTASQCNIGVTPEETIIAAVHKDNPQLTKKKHEEILKNVSILCDKMNSVKNSHYTTNIVYDNDLNKGSTEEEPSLSYSEAQNSADTEPVNHSTLTVHTTDNATPNDRIFPPGFFAQSRHRDCKVKIVKMEQTNDDTDDCLCDSTDNSTVSNMSKKVSQILEQEQDDSSNSTSPSPTISNLASSLMSIKKSQDNDPILKTVKQWLLAGDKPTSIQAHRAPKELVSYWKQYSLLVLKNDVIMRKWITINKGVEEAEKHLLCVPEEMQESILSMCHSSLATNHPGIKLTLDICRRYYYFPGMS